MASHRARNERAEIAAVTRMSLVLPAVASAVIALLTLALASLLSPLVLGEHLPWLIVLAALSIPFATMQLPLQHVLQGFEDVGGQNVVYVVYSAVFTVTVLVGAYVGGLYGAVIGLAIGNAVLAGLYLGRTGRLLALARAPLRGARRGAGSAGPLLRIGAASLAVTVVYGAADLAVRTTLLHTNGSRSAGYWFALLTVSVQFIASLAGAMSYFTAPLAARAVGEGKREETQRLLDDSLRLAIRRDHAGDRAPDRDPSRDRRHPFQRRVRPDRPLAAHPADRRRRPHRRLGPRGRAGAARTDARRGSSTGVGASIVLRRRRLALRSALGSGWSGVRVADHLDRLDDCRGCRFDPQRLLAAVAADARGSARDGSRRCGNHRFSRGDRGRGHRPRDGGARRNARRGRESARASSAPSRALLRT